MLVLHELVELNHRDGDLGIVHLRSDFLAIFLKVLNTILMKRLGVLSKLEGQVQLLEGNKAGFVSDKIVDEVLDLCVYQLLFQLG